MGFFNGAHFIKIQLTIMDFIFRSIWASFPSFILMAIRVLEAVKLLIKKISTSILCFLRRTKMALF